MPKPKFNFQIPTVTGVQTNGNADNVAALIQKATAPVSDPPPMEIKYIPRHRIRENKKNTYPINEIQSLKKSILFYGLQQPMTVSYITSEDHYVIEAGHRRTAAIDSLLYDFKQCDPQDKNYEYYLKNVKQFTKGYPCIIKASLNDQLDYDMESDNLDTIPDELIDSEIRLYITNEENRPPLDPAQKAKAVARLAALYDRKNKKAKNRTEKVNVNKEVSKVMNITERQVIDYRHIDTLIPQLKKEFEAKRFTIKTAAGIAKLEPDEQEDLYTMLQADSSPSAVEILERMKMKNDALEKEVKELKASSDTLNKLDLEFTYELKTFENNLKSITKLLESTDSSMQEKYRSKLIQIFHKSIQDTK